LGFNIPGELKNLDTVAIDTPAAAAMSSMVMVAFFARRFLPSEGAAREGLDFFISRVILSALSIRRIGGPLTEFLKAVTIYLKFSGHSRPIG
jgi:hypothetical protein